MSHPIDINNPPPDIEWFSDGYEALKPLRDHLRAVLFAAEHDNERMTPVQFWVSPVIQNARAALRHADQFFERIENQRIKALPKLKRSIVKALEKILSTPEGQRVKMQLIQEPPTSLHSPCPQCGPGGKMRKSKGIEPSDICWICSNTFQVKHSTDCHLGNNHEDCPACNALKRERDSVHDIGRYSPRNRRQVRSSKPTKKTAKEEKRRGPIPAPIKVAFSHSEDMHTMSTRLLDQLNRMTPRWSDKSLDWMQCAVSSVIKQRREYAAKAMRKEALPPAVTGYEAIVAFSGGEVVGWAMLDHKRFVRCKRYRLALYVYVRPKQRRKGIGRQLAEIAKEKAQQRGWPIEVTPCTKTNRAFFRSVNLLQSTSKTKS